MATEFSFFKDNFTVYIRYNTYLTLRSKAYVCELSSNYRHVPKYRTVYYMLHDRRIPDKFNISFRFRRTHNTQQKEIKYISASTVYEQSYIIRETQTYNTHSCNFDVFQFHIRLPLVTNEKKLNISEHYCTTVLTQQLRVAVTL
jgi:hypothetical protein